MLHEIEPDHLGFTYMVPETVFERTYNNHNSTREEWIAEAVSGDVDRMIITNGSKMECGTESLVNSDKLALNGSDYLIEPLYFRR